MSHVCLRRRRYKQQQAALQAAIAADVRSRLRPHVAWAVYGIFTVCSLQEQTHFLPSLLLNGLTLLGARSLASPPLARRPRPAAHPRDLTPSHHHHPIPVTSPPVPPFPPPRRTRK